MLRLKIDNLVILTSKGRKTMKKLALLTVVVMLTAACATGKTTTQMSTSPKFMPQVAASYQQDAVENEAPQVDRVAISNQIQEGATSVYGRHEELLNKEAKARNGQKPEMINSFKLLANVEFMQSRHNLRLGLDPAIEEFAEQLKQRKNIDTVGFAEAGNSKTPVAEASRIIQSATIRGAINPEFMKQKWDLKNGVGTFQRWVELHGYNGPNDHIINCVEWCE